MYIVTTHLSHNAGRTGRIRNNLQRAQSAPPCIIYCYYIMTCWCFQEFVSKKLREKEQKISCFLRERRAVSERKKSRLPGRQKESPENRGNPRFSRQYIKIQLQKTEHFRLTESEHGPYAHGKNPKTCPTAVRRRPAQRCPTGGRTKSAPRDRAWSDRPSAQRGWNAPQRCA